MVFYHCSQFSNIHHNYVSELLSIVFSCFMAWFFFKSGMFHKTDITSLKNEFIYAFQKLWRPYLLFWCIGIIISAVKFYSVGDTNWIHYLLTPIKSTLLSGSNNGALPMWFLVTLLMVRTLSPIMLNKCRGYGWIICGIVGVILCFINSTHRMNLIKPYYFANFFPAMFFYGLGFYMKDKQFNLMTFVLAFVIYIISFIWPSTIDFRTNAPIRGNALLWYIYAAAGIMVFNYICKKINFSICFVTKIGQNSMWWFLAHWPILNLSNILYGNIYKLEGWGLIMAEFMTIISILILFRPLVNQPSFRRWT